MPLDRTPPASPALCDVVSETENITENVSPLRQHSSEPDMSSLVNLVSVTERKKRKRDGDHNLSLVIQDMFAAFSKNQEGNFAQLRAVIEGLNEQNAELKKSIERMSGKYDEFLIQIKNLEQQKNEDKKTITHLEDRIDYLERKSRSTGLEIKNVPKLENETKERLCNVVKNLGKVLNLDVNSNSIKDIYRTNPKKDKLHKPIIVEFNTVLLKDKILQNIKTFNKSKKKEEKLNTSHLQFNQPVNPIFVTETLTTRTQKLFYLARTFQKSHGFTYCWTSHGVIYLRKDENSPQIRINTEADINRLKSSI
ncbi:uncharacterized protein LOC123666437 [Melitaea cinxia]|uniref:uncharacterized protein LOC123666437 n=1 Tax=Melitaea cinxia TaxID=113334 RepID=UPI001E2729C8|nr:uncharacterized protein LOC123666437 [Melitaea cinxia]